MRHANTINFKMMSFVHETLYGLFRDPYPVLDTAGLQPGQTVLEVGCGPGFFTVPAAEIVGDQGHLTTVDINPLAISRVKEKIAAAGATNITPILTDAAQTGLPDGSFDLVFIFGFKFADGYVGPIMREIHRLLKPGGILATEGQLETPRELFEPLRQPNQRQGRIYQFGKRN
jgi:ubiquinone/menaquinone biosynthesis C-methylase UbiE